MDAQATIAADISPWSGIRDHPQLRRAGRGKQEGRRFSQAHHADHAHHHVGRIIVITLRSFSVRQMLVVLLCIPLGFIGVGWGHWIHGVQISLFSFFGVIALIGVMVNDSLVLISTFNANMKEGLSFHQSLRDAALSRLRPILLTSLTTVAGLLPLTLNRTFQAQFLIPMAITVAYGLAIATFVTLIILPTLLATLNQLRQVRWWVWNAEWPTPEADEPAVKELPYENLEETRD
ncbi:MAG: efflux RND transporter permease subunit [Flavobacteriales bacterium]